MDSYLCWARASVGALVPALLLTLGCAGESRAADLASGDRLHTAFEARPSPALADLLTAGAHYRIVSTANDELALLIVAPDQRILGRLHISAAPGPHSSHQSVQVELDFTGAITRVEAWSSGEGFHGHASVGDRAVRWRVRYQANGELAGERWTSKQRGTATVEELRSLRDAQAIGADLGSLLSRGEPGACELAERLAFAELALELSVRAWAGRGRAELPTVPFAAAHEVGDDLCAL